MHHLQHIAEIALMLRHEGIRHIVICPGSRNAPMMQVFERDDFFSCHSIVDERSAGYIALGMARELNKTVAVVTTSGTAVLNLGPAIAEAFYQRIPLLILTADRPNEWPPQFNNQIVSQVGVFDNNCKSSYCLPRDIESSEEFETELGSVYSLIRGAAEGTRGPVHLNIPLKEPLYVDIPGESVFTIPFVEESVAFHATDELTEYEKGILKSVKSEKKVLLIAGMRKYSAGEIEILKKLTGRFQLALIAENISNIPLDTCISNPELVLASMDEDDQKILTPDVVICFGGQVVSKKTRIFVQELENVPVYTLEEFPLRLFKTIYNEYLGADINHYQASWKKREEECREKVTAFTESQGFSNIYTLMKIVTRKSPDLTLHLGNSGTVRYSQLFPNYLEQRTFANRGTSGIDGTLSSAVGAAMVSNELHLVILGDLSFVYDSNALWNRELPSNLRIVVVNDEGGGIFSLLKGPDKMSFYREFSVAHHPVDLVLLLKAFGVDARACNNENEFEKALKSLLSEEGGLQAMVVHTAGYENSSIFKNLFKTLKK